MENAEDFSDQLEAAFKAICTFFHSVTQYFTNIMTASGRNNNSSFGMQHQRLQLDYEFEDEDDDGDNWHGGHRGGVGGLASQLLTEE